MLSILLQIKIVAFQQFIFLKTVTCQCNIMRLVYNPNHTLFYRGIPSKFVY